MCDNGIVLVHSSMTARCKLSPAGYERMFRIRWSLNRLYNDSLEERKRAYQQRKQKLSFYDQCKVLTKLRQTNEHGLGTIAVGPARGMLKRLDEAFKSFFRRVKVGQKPGYPRFRALSRCVTIDVTNIRPSVLRDCGTYYAIRIKGLPEDPVLPVPDAARQPSVAVPPTYVTGTPLARVNGLPGRAGCLGACDRRNRYRRRCPQADDVVERQDLQATQAELETNAQGAAGRPPAASRGRRGGVNVLSA